MKLTRNITYINTILTNFHEKNENVALSLHDLSELNKLRETLFKCTELNILYTDSKKRIR